MTKDPLLKHLANIITFIRILGVGAIFWLTPYHSNLQALWVILLFTLVSLTDLLDGWIARRLNIVSDLGKVLDPLADKLLVLVFLPLLTMQVIPSFPVFIILAREFSIMAIRIVSAKNGIIIPANFSGKLKTALTFPLCGMLFARVPVDAVSLPLLLQPLEFLRMFIFTLPDTLINVLIWATVAVTIWSFTTYLKAFIWEQTLRKHQQDKAKAKHELLKMLPTFITFCNLLAGFLAIIFSLQSKLTIAIFLVYLGMYLDALDGRLARKFNVNSKLGEYLDSKADFVSFGIAPAAIIYMALLALPYPWPILALVPALYFFSVYYRLKRFNKTGGHTHFFEGLPSPIGAALVLIPLTTQLLNHAGIVLIFSLCISLVMISKIPYPHLNYTSQTYLKYFSRPGLFFFFGTLFQLLSVPYTHLIPFAEILFLFSLVYLSSPLFLRKHFKK